MFNAVLTVNGAQVPFTLYSDRAYSKTGQKGTFTVLPASAYLTFEDAGRGFSVRVSCGFIIREVVRKVAKETVPADSSPFNDVMSAVVERVLEQNEINELRKECERLRRENECLRSEYRSRVMQRALQKAAVVYSE